MHPALRDTNRTGDEIRPLMLVGDPCYRVLAPNSLLPCFRSERHSECLTSSGASAAISTELSSSTLIDAGRARPAPHDQPERPLRRPF